MTRRLIIDTDTAGDDAFSILMALKHPDITLEALTICTGNVDFDQQVENALWTLQVGGQVRGGQDNPGQRNPGQDGPVPVYAGCRRPLIRKPVQASYVFGRDGFSDADYPPADQRPDPAHAVDEIVRRVMSAPGEIEILAQAPLTNIAAAVTREPRIAQAVKHLWIMGGTDNSIGNVTPAAEFNFYVDPEAARIVMEAGFKVTLVTWTIAVRQSALLPETADRIIAAGTGATDFFAQVRKAAKAYSLSRGRQPTHPDTVACACMIDPAVMTEVAQCHVDIETEGRLTRGYSAVSSPMLPDTHDADPDLAAAGPNARVVKSIDHALFERMFLRTFGLGDA